MTKPQQKNDSYIETRVALLEQSIGHINNTLAEMKLDLRMNFNTLDNKIDSNFKWLLSLIITSIVVPIIFKIFIHYLGW